MRCVLILGALVLSGCTVADPDSPTTAPEAPQLPDPLAMGPLDVLSTEWSGQATIVTGAQSDGVPRAVYPVEMQGTMHQPVSDGPWPAAVLMHGRHATCRYADTLENFAVVCPDADPVIRPVPSAEGYEYLGQHLASHGILVISVNANNVNDADGDWSAIGDDRGATARAQVIGEVLRRLSDAHAGTAVMGWPDLTGRLDLDQVGLMGHSRGGEGVVAATSLIEAGRIDPGDATIAAVFALAPTDFARWTFRGPAFATLLPYCDGDVSSLHGAWMFDDMSVQSAGRGPLYQFVAMGANHNFYNTVWTNDDFGPTGDPWCGSEEPGNGRDSPEAQRAHGVMLMSAFFRAHLADEGGFLPFMRGEASWPMDGIKTSYAPPDAADAPLEGHVVWFSAGSHDHQQGVFEGEISIRPCSTSCQAQRTIGQAERLEVSWDGPAAWRTAEVHIDPAMARTTLRVAIAPGSNETMLQSTVGVGDDLTTLEQLGVTLPPGDDWAKTILSDVELDLPPGKYPLHWRFVGQGTIHVQGGFGYSSK